MSIAKYHDELMQFLLEQRAENGLKFAVRKTNRYKRLDKGYWFIGGEDYLQISFWDGKDSLRRIHNIGFTVKEDGTGYLEFSAKEMPETSKFLGRLQKKFDGEFIHWGADCWYRPYKGNDPVKALEKFLSEDKEKIDSSIKRNPNCGISFLDEEYDRKHVDSLLAERILNTRIARICWNTNDWQKPSGREAKSNHPKAYEKQHGFGHEEWLFDTDKLIDGYHYGFIQAIGSHHDKYLDQTFNLGLYTINSKEHKSYWLGRITKAEVISRKESKKAVQIYRGNGWLKEMHGQLAEVGVSAEDSLFNDNLLFNIKYKPEDLDLSDEMLEVDGRDVINSNYYSSMLITTKEPGYSALLPTTNRPVLSNERKGFEFESGHNSKKKGRVNKRGQRPGSSQLIHNELQEKIFSLLEKEYGEGNVGTENKVGSNRFIDIVVKHGKNSFTFYELKTGFSIKTNIREALGQLLEYAYWPNNNYAKKLIIISPQLPSESVKLYVGSLRERFNLPVYYRGYDIVNNELTDIV